jgi:hypothetical protein
MNRRTAAAACLVASAILHSLSYFLWPANSEGTHAEQLTAAGSHSGAWAAATWVETAGWLLLAAALVVVWQEVRGRGRRLTAIGVWVAELGMAGFFGAGVMNIVTIRLGRYADHRAALAVFNWLHKDTGLFLFVVAPIMLGTLALVLVMVGLARAGWLGWWAPVAAFVGVAASQALSASANPFLLTLAFAPMAVPWIAAARRLVVVPPAAKSAAARESSPAMA